MSVSHYNLINSFHTKKKRSCNQAKVQLYAVGVGLGMDPLDEDQLAFLQGENLTVLPSFATVAAWDVAHTRELGMAWAKLIHVSQRLTLSVPLAPAVRGRVRQTGQERDSFGQRGSDGKCRGRH